MSNALLENFELPPFSRITPDIIRPAIEQILADNRSRIDRLPVNGSISWESVVEPLELLDDRLNKAWSPVRHLNSVRSSDELRDAYNECLPLLIEYSTEIGQNRALCEAYQQIADSNDFEQLTEAQRKTITDSLLHFRLGGVDLSGEDKAEFQRIQQRLSELQSKFENNVLDATHAWQLHLPNNDQLGGLPGYALDMLKHNADKKSLDGYRLTLDMPCYIAVVTYADDRALREQIYRAYTTRASDQAENTQWDNGDIMVEILALRQQKARLLGFTHYAELSLQTKMAQSYQEVEEFLLELSAKGLPVARKEFEELQEFAREQGLGEELQAWDLAYYSEQLRQQRYSISEEDLKPYFADHRVIDGMLEIAQRLFRVSFRRMPVDHIDRWHEDVSFYHVLDEQDQVIGRFYLDPYAREHKRGGAWMDECMGRYVINGNTQLPVAYLTCNLTPPIGDQPALCTHDEVITLFHEFGHGLHHLLTRVDVPEVSGINGVEWDAVELPSQFMENFCWQREALNMFARHHETGDPLPQELYDRMIAAKNFQSAMQMQRQLEFSLFDMELHRRQDIDDAGQIQAQLDEIRQRVAVVRPPAFNRFQNSFSHIFAGGYAAGYYSYKWAEVLSADAFSRFEEHGIFDAATGERFLQCILQRGGERPARETFHCFMQRDPQIDALLRHHGIQQ